MKRSNDYQVYTKADIAVMRTMADAGASNAQIAAKLGRGERAVAEKRLQLRIFVGGKRRQPEPARIP